MFDPTLGEIVRMWWNGCAGRLNSRKIYWYAHPEGHNVILARQGFEDDKDAEVRIWDIPSELDPLALVTQLTAYEPDDPLSHGWRETTPRHRTGLR
jgi:hypothetical protein